MENLGLVFGTFCLDGPTILETVFRNPSAPVEGRGKLKVYTGISKLNNDFENPLEALKMQVAGASLPDWELVEAPDDVISDIVGHWPVRLAVLATFCSEKK